MIALHRPSFLFVCLFVVFFLLGNVSQVSDVRPGGLLFREGGYICKIPHCKSSFTSGNWEMAWKDYVHSAIVAKIGDEFVDFLTACFQFRMYMPEISICDVLNFLNTNKHPLLHVYKSQLLWWGCHS